MRNYFRALSFLTIIPVPFVQFSSDGNELSDSASAFPLAGATIGLVLAGTGWALTYLFPLSFSALFVLMTSFFLTRGLHLDGLADTADGLIGTADREKAFKAMKDSATGVMGAAIVFFVLLMKFILLTEIGIMIFPLVLFLMPLAGRWAIVISGTWFNPAREEGLGDLFLCGLNWKIFAKSSVCALVVAGLVGLILPHFILPVTSGLIFTLSGAFLLAFYAFKRLGGLTGDILGAASEVGELFFLVGFYLALHAI